MLRDSGNHHSLRVATCLGLGFAVCLAGAADPGSEATVWLTPWQWRLLPVRAGVKASGVTAIAFDPVGRRVAVGDASGVALRVQGGGFRRVAARALVTDLHFSADGALWIATRTGLWRLSSEGRLEDRSPAPGEIARAIARVQSTGELYLVATGAGAYASTDGRTWRRLAGGIPSGPVPVLALRSAPGAARADLWIVAGRTLWRAELDVKTGLVGRAQRETIVGGPTGTAPVDVVLDLPGADVAVVFPRVLALYDAARRHWQVTRPALPPEANARRLAWAHDTAWLATDRGLLRARALAGSWWRSEAPAGRARSAVVLGVPNGILVAADTGLIEGSERALAAAAVATPLRADPSEIRALQRADPSEIRALQRADPSEIRALQTAALRYLGLGPERMRALRRGVDRRGLLPVMSLRVGYERGRSRSEDFDQSFVSGETRKLYDLEYDRDRELDASVVLTWDLGDVAYNPDAEDLSREARQVIALRDDVLDEINQLYFERRGILESLAADPVAPEAQRLRLRADELAAGLDAWTGAWFSSHRDALETAREPTSSPRS